MLKKHNYIFEFFIILAIISLLIACTNKSQSNFQIQSKQFSKSKSKQFVSTSSLQDNFLNKLNKLRAKGRNCGNKYYPAAAPLVANNRLFKAARQHSIDMAKHGYLGHISSNGDTLVERLAEVKYIWQAIGENVAHNQRNIDEVLEDWLSSPGHCSNLMSAEYNQTGVAQKDWYWTQVYAAPRR